MSALLLIFIQNPQIHLMTPQGLRHGYEPFWASHWWLADNNQYRQRVITAEEYIARVMRSDEASLRMRCGERGMTPCASREETIAQLLAIFDGLTPPDHLDVATWAELVNECRSLGLDASGAPEDMRARLRAAAQAARPPCVPDGPVLDDAPADVPAAPDDMPPEPKPAPIEAAKSAAKLSALDVQQLAQLKAALAADDYQTVWSVGTNLTSTRPASKSKTAVYEWAEGVIRDLEG